MLATTIASFRRRFCLKRH